MNLTNESSKINNLKDMFDIDIGDNQFVIALAGNPNTDKSTVFNYFTGLKQHTGNWPGKTVATARGEFKYKDSDYVLVDLPGTYSLFALSQEEILARDFICFGNPDAVIVVCDASCLERNLNLAFQVMELTDKVILCINLVDEASKKGITINPKKIEDELGIPVVLTSARNGNGMDELLEAVYKVSFNEYTFNTQPVIYESNIESIVDCFKSEIQSTIDYINPRWLALRLIDEDESLFHSMRTYISEDIVDSIFNIKKEFPRILDKQKLRDNLTRKNYDFAKKLTNLACHVNSSSNLDKDEEIDSIVTSRFFGFSIMLLWLGAILWITIQGANYPSTLIANFLFGLEPKFTDFLNCLNAPAWIILGFLILTAIVFTVCFLTTSLYNLIF